VKSEEPKNGEVARSAQPADGRDYLQLWISLASREWGSLVVIPADRDGSTAEIASGLANIGQQLSYGAVTAVTMSSLVPGSALALADLQQHMKGELRRLARDPATIDIPSEASTAAPPEGARPDGGAAPEARVAEQAAPSEAATPTEASRRSPGDALMVTQHTRLIISVPPVITEPLGLAVAKEAGAVVLAVRMKHSRIAEVRQTIQLVGRDRINGCLLVR
jgi:hypothetical protein